MLKHPGSVPICLSDEGLGILIKGGVLQKRKMVLLWRGTRNLTSSYLLLFLTHSVRYWPLLRSPKFKSNLGEDSEGNFFTYPQGLRSLRAPGIYQILSGITVQSELGFLSSCGTEEL